MAYIYAAHAKLCGDGILLNFFAFFLQCCVVKIYFLIKVIHRSVGEYSQLYYTVSHVKKLKFK